MLDDYLSDDELARENERLKLQLHLLGRDGSVFDELEPDVANFRLKELLRYAEDEREARLLGKEPPPQFLDPASMDWIPDLDDMVHRSAGQLLGEDFILWPEEFLSDEEVKEQLHAVIDKLAEQGIGVAYNETVPEVIAYRELLSDLEPGLDVMPGLYLDGCDGCCEECFQLPYCKTGQDLAHEYDFEVPLPVIAPRRVRSHDNPRGARPYGRALKVIPQDPLGPPKDHQDHGDSFDDVPF